MIFRYITIFSILLFSNACLCFGQPPNIYYPPALTFSFNLNISLTPENTGGVVPYTNFGQVVTYAGNGVPVTLDGPGSASGFNLPLGLCADSYGNIYAADYGNGAIRKITSAPVTTTIANVNTPSALVADSKGNIFVTDINDNSIYKISNTGVKSVYAGNGIAGSTDGIAGSASFNKPAGIVIDASGNLIIADRGNNKIRKISAAGVVTTIAGSGITGAVDGNGILANFNAPGGLAVDKQGNIYVADSGNNLIRKIDSSGLVTTIAGTAAGFNDPEGIAVDASGNLYVTDRNNNLIRKITPAGLVTTLAGDGTPGNTDGIGTAANFNRPSGIIPGADGNIYIADTGNNLIRTITLTGYTIDKALPAGLNFDPVTGIISGKPTAISPRTTYTITAYNTEGSSSVKVTIDVIGVGFFSYTPIPDKTVCDADFSPGATGTGVINYVSSDPKVATIVLGKIHITGSGVADIMAVDPPFQVTQRLSVSPASTPVITISPAAVDDCAGTMVTYTATIANGGTNPIYQWQVNGLNTGTGGSRFTAVGLNNNDKVTCILTSNITGCVSANTATSNISTFVTDAPAITLVSITSSVSGPVCKGDNITFSAIAVTPDKTPNYQWQVNGKNAGINSPVFAGNNFNDGDIIKCVLSSKGKCLINAAVVSNAFQVQLSPASGCIVTIPNTFTPNSDGINDIWNITALMRYPNCTVKVYNRYGTLIFNSVGYPIPWDGHFNNKLLPTGVYYYIVDLKNALKPLTGSVTIIK